MEEGILYLTPHVHMQGYMHLHIYINTQHTHISHTTLITEREREMELGGKKEGWQVGERREERRLIYSILNL